MNDSVKFEERPPFQKALEQLINRYSVENASDTPDFILATYIKGCLDNFTSATRSRDAWHGFVPWAELRGDATIAPPAARG